MSRLASVNTHASEAIVSGLEVGVDATVGLQTVVANSKSNAPIKLRLTKLGFGCFKLNKLIFTFFVRISRATSSSYL